MSEDAISEVKADYVKLDKQTLSSSDYATDIKKYPILE